MELRYPYQLPPLPYAYDALEDEISEKTLHFHHDKHLKSYIDNLNTALADRPEEQNKTLEELLRHLDCLSGPKRTAIRNNGGGVYNHLLYFNCLSPERGLRPSGGLAAALERYFGSYDDWRAAMKAAALNVRINTKSMADREAADKMNAEAAGLYEKYEKEAEKIYQNVYGRLV